MARQEALRTRQGSGHAPEWALDSLCAPHPGAARRSKSHVCRGVHGAHGRGVRTAGSGATRGGEAVTANLIGLALAVSVAVYMVAALLFPERF
ncbi:potassium-transporting ATPase subunit F [Nocardia sp. bgisy134]|uniref:potassium-transporting ATPase subunit F n=1 Tax=unclassified Nocardia TaxID=2637762 RepID=UPI003D742B9C